jgi:membrane protein YdbS with pleckstrin-like domain
MEFINGLVISSSLPEAEKLELQPVQYSYLKLLRIEWVIVSFILLACALTAIFVVPYFKADNRWLIPLAAWLLVSGFSFLVREKGFSAKAYAIRQHDAVYRKGWIIRSVRICPFNRIQNCTVHSGPLERKFGLAALTLFTAGSEGADMRIPGLLQQEAENIRQFILSRINHVAGQ